MSFHLAELMKSGATLDAVARALEAMDHAGRVQALSSSNRAQQRWLYELAAHAEPVTLEQLCPSSLPAGTPVMHHGRNTLPLPRAFRFFQKPMCRPRDGSERLFGYNEGASRPIVGPGYFVAYSTAGKPHWESHGAVVVDYFQVPDAEVADGWPKVVPNTKGLQIVVFHGTRDFLRRVSDHVTIGAAFKREKPLGHYFTLVREDR